jgi:hypothetical protein
LAVQTRATACRTIDKMDGRIWPRLMKTRGTGSGC